MITSDTAIEIVSPLNYRDTDCVCRVARMPGLVATCSGCGRTVYRNVHLPLIAFGFYCWRCCPCFTFVPTAEEVAVMERNRARPDAGSEDAVERKPVQRAVKPVESQEDRRARTKVKLAAAMKKRWADTAQRAAFVIAMKGRKPARVKTAMQPMVVETPTRRRKPTIPACLLAAGISPFWKG